MEKDDEDGLLLGLKDLEKLLPLNPNASQSLNANSNQWSMVVIRDPSRDKHTKDDFSVFPPSNHENLIPTHFDLHPKHPPPPSPFSPLSPMSSSPSDFDQPFSPPPSPVCRVNKWWGVALQIWRSKMANVGLYRGRNGGRDGVNGKGFWSFGKVALAVVVGAWWLCLRLRKRRGKRHSVGQLLQIIREKDEKIIQLLNQIVQTNELLLAGHKIVAPKRTD